MRKLFLAAAVAAAFSVSACTLPAGPAGPLPAAQAVGVGLATAVTLYCVGVTDQAKQIIRAELTGGQQVLACPQGFAPVMATQPAAPAAAAAPAQGAAPAPGAP